MAATKSKTKVVEKSHYILFKKKAEDFYFEMADALDQGRWNAVGLLAVHCAISINDALCCKFLGQICASTSHSEAARFLSTHFPSSEAKSKAIQLAQIIAHKHIVEYEDRVFSEVEAKEIFKKTERFYQWSTKQLGRP